MREMKEKIKINKIKKKKLLIRIVMNIG